MKLQMPDVTLICLSDVMINQSIFALETCKKYADFGAVKFLSSRQTRYEHHIQIPKKINSLDDYSQFILEHLTDYVNTKFCLVVQWDGFIVKPEAWSDEFYKYDYIGAPYRFVEHEVGNGGFSLRSKKLLDATKKVMESAKDIGVDLNYPEDRVVSQFAKPHMKHYGIRVAPLDVARRFSTEAKYEGAFGFHNYYFAYNLSEEWHNPFKTNPFEITGMHSGAIGDLIYALPTIKKLGINKILINTGDAFKKKFGYGITDEGYASVKPLLESQGYKVDRYDDNFVVDYYLDSWRYNGRCLRYNHIINTHGYAFDVNVSEYLQEPFISLPASSKVWDVAISRSERRHNPGFNYGFILKNVDQKKCCFLGTEAEYWAFRNEWNANGIQYIPTKNLLAMAIAVSKSKLFIGNQSCGFALAEGLKINRIQETSPEEPNCMPISMNGISAMTGEEIWYARHNVESWTGYKPSSNKPRKIGVDREFAVDAIDEFDKIWGQCTQYKVQQKYEEFVPFLRFAKEKKLTGNALEIGFYNGGTTVGLLNIFDNVLSIDMQYQTTWDELQKQYPKWCCYQHNSHEVSFAQSIVEPWVKKHGLLDLLVIDGDHSNAGSKKDYDLYKQFVRTDGIIMFHDILDTKYHRSLGCTVSDTWKELARDNVTKEFVCKEYTNAMPKHDYLLNNAPSYDQWGGIGVVFVPEEIV